MRLYERETISDARRIRDESEARRRAMDASPGYTLGTYRAREGEDLRDVSRLYYGTPMQWRPIMLFNGMNTIELYTGQTIAIPRLDPDAPQDT
jgi:nucleoid-associated protein YgaU